MQLIGVAKELRCAPVERESLGSRGLSIENYSRRDG